MVAVPIVSRASETIGVIVLHTEAPREFTEDTLKLLVHIASLVSGAIENAQLYDQQRRRVDALTSLSGLAQEVATAGDAGEIGRAVTLGMRRLLGRRGVPAVPPGPRRDARSDCCPPRPRRPPSPRRCRRPRCCWRRSTARASRPPARTLWPELDVADLLVTPLVVGRRAARAAVRRRAAAPAVHRRGHRDGARDRAPGRDRDQAGRADRGADQREHRQGPVRGARRGGDRVRGDARRRRSGAICPART